MKAMWIKKVSRTESNGGGEQNMIIKAVAIFLAGLFFANGIPHFVNGISGKDFHNPTLHRFVPDLPSPLFNVIWGMFNFGLVIFFLSLAGILNFATNTDIILFATGFAFA